MSNKAETFVKYHEEHANFGGASREFHEMASSFLRCQAEEIVALTAECARLRGEVESIRYVSERALLGRVAKTLGWQALMATQPENEILRAIATLTADLAGAQAIARARTADLVRATRDAEEWQQRTMAHQELIEDVLEALSLERHAKHWSVMVAKIRALTADLARVTGERDKWIRNFDSCHDDLDRLRVAARDVLTVAYSAASLGILVAPEIEALQAAIAACAPPASGEEG